MKKTKQPHPDPEGLFEEAVAEIPEGQLEVFLLRLESLAKDPRIEVVRDSRGRPVLFRARPTT